MVSPSGGIEVDASKVTSSGTVPEEGVAVKAATGSTVGIGSTEMDTISSSLLPFESSTVSVAENVPSAR